MGKTKELEKPDYESFTTIKAVEEETDKHKNQLVRKVKQLLQTKENKKETISDFNEQIKILQEEVEHEVAVLDELNKQRRVVEKGATLRSV